MLASGANVLVPRFPASPLARAMEGHDVDRVRSLLSAKANAGQDRDSRRTPSIPAAYSRAMEGVVMLPRARASVNPKDDDGRGGEAAWMEAMPLHAVNQAALAAAGGIEALTAVLHEHAANAEVMQYACGALYTIGASDRALQKRIWEAGAEPVVRAAVNAPDATADTRKQGQRLLDKLAEVSVCVECGCVYTRAPVPAMASVSEYV